MLCGEGQVRLEGVLVLHGGGVIERVRVLVQGKGVCGYGEWDGGEGGEGVRGRSKLKSGGGCDSGVLWSPGVRGNTTPPPPSDEGVWTDEPSRLVSASETVFAANSRHFCVFDIKFALTREAAISCAVRLPPR